MRLFIIFWLFIPTVVIAQQVAQIDADLNGDGRADRAFLTVNTQSGDADLSIFVRRRDGFLEMHTKATDLVWNGGIGQEASLGVNPRGSLLIHSKNESIGRNRWHQTLAIAWRNNRFVLAGFTYNWYDTLNINHSGNCDINMLTGKGILYYGHDDVMKIIFKTRSKGGPIDQWVPEIPQQCTLK